MKTRSTILIVLALTAGCQSVPRGRYASIEEFRRSEALAPLYYRTPFATEIAFVVELIDAYRRENSELPASTAALEEFSQHHDVSELAVEFLKKNLVLSEAQQRVECLCWDLTTRKHRIIATPTGEFRVSGEVYGTGSFKNHVTYRDGYSSSQFVSEVKKVSYQPSQPVQTTPGAVTPPAAAGAAPSPSVSDH